MQANLGSLRPSAPPGSTMPPKRHPTLPSTSRWSSAREPGMAATATAPALTFARRSFRPVCRPARPPCARGRLRGRARPARSLKPQPLRVMTPLAGAVPPGRRPNRYQISIRPLNRLAANVRHQDTADRHRRRHRNGREQGDPLRLAVHLFDLSEEPANGCLERLQRRRAVDDVRAVELRNDRRQLVHSCGTGRRRQLAHIDRSRQVDDQRHRTVRAVLVARDRETRRLAGLGRPSATDCRYRRDDAGTRTPAPCRPAWRPDARAAGSERSRTPPAWIDRPPRSAKHPSSQGAASQETARSCSRMRTGFRCGDRCVDVAALITTLEFRLPGASPEGVRTLERRTPRRDRAPARAHPRGAVQVDRASVAEYRRGNRTWGGSWHESPKSNERRDPRP